MSRLFSHQQQNNKKNSTFPNLFEPIRPLKSQGLLSLLFILVIYSDI